MSEDSDNIIEQTLGDVNNKKEEKRRKELFKLTSGKPCPECLGLVKHYPSALYCKECMFWIHMGCASSHFVDGKCQQVAGSGSPNSKRFVMPRTNEDFAQLTTLTKRQHIERDLDFTKVYQLPQFQPTPPKPEKPKIEKSGTTEKERKHRNSTRRGRERTPSPGPSKPPLSPLLSSSRSPSPDSNSSKFQQSNKIINKVRGGTPFLFGVSNIACSCFFDVCLICGASGTLYKDLVGCADCGECFHLRCIHYAGSYPPPPGKVWRCSRCSVCYKCGKYTHIGKDGIECSTCSRYYHFACASPTLSSPKENPHATLFWECDRCKIDRYLESLKNKVEESKHENELKMEESKNENELKMENITLPPPELEPFEEYSPLHIFPDTRACLVCGGAEGDEMPGNHLLPSGINMWVHTLCAMLTSGTFVMHGRLYELQESAKKWAGKPCGVCGKCDNGATVACAHSGCARVFHPLCAAKLKGGKLYTNKDPRVYRKEVYLFYCDEHGCAHSPDSLACEPPLAKVPRLGEYTDIDAYREITFESLLEGIPPKVVQSMHRVHRVGFLRLGALSIISPGVRHGKIGFECPEGNKDREDLLLRMGWKSYRVFWDFKAPEERCVYCCEVVPKNNAVKNSRKLVTEGEARVTVFRSPDSRLASETFSSDSPSKIWEHIIESLNARRSMAGLRGRTVFRGGNFYFGFTSILMNLAFNEEDGTNTTSFVESPLNLYHNILKRQQAYRGNWRGVSCEGSSRSAGTQLWKRTKKAKQLSLRDLYVTRDERSEEIQNLLSSYTIGSVNNNTSNNSSSSNSSGSTGSGSNAGSLAISSATFSAMTNSPALSSLIGGNGSSFGGTDSHGGVSSSSSGNFGNGAGVAGNEGGGGGRRGLIHHDTYELPMAIRYKQLLQSEDDFVSMKSPIQGLGMFAAKLCTPESMLLEYRGEIIRISVGDIREERYRKRGLADYLFSFSDKHIIDATMCGANARFVNHCHAPNCRAKIIQVSGMKHIVIVSKTFITPGEELCYDYNFPIEDESSKVPCTCAAPDCPGFMN